MAHQIAATKRYQNITTPIANHITEPMKTPSNIPFAALIARLPNE